MKNRKKLNHQIEQLQSKLSSIQYENIKLNAQIEILNNTIDSNNEKLDELKNANSQLKMTNQTLKDNNKHYWLFTILITFAGSVLGWFLGKYFA